MPLCCAAGLAVLQVIKEEKLQAAALATGVHLKAGLARLQVRVTP